MDRADSAPGHRQGPHILAPGPGSGGGNRPPRRQADPGAPPLPRGAPKGRHNCHFQPAAGESDSESGSRLRFLQKRPRGEALSLLDRWLAAARPGRARALTREFGPFRSFQPQAESGGCVVLSGHLAAMMAPPGRPGDVEVGYPPRTPAQARVCTAPGDVPAPCPRSPRGYRSMVRVAIGSAIHHFSLFHSRPVAIDTTSPAC